MKKQYLTLIFLLSLFFRLSAASAQDYYVSAQTGSDTNSGLTPETPFATLQKGADVVGPGGTVFIMNGRYVRTSFGSVLDIKRSGTSDGYITFKPYPGHSPVISAYGGSWDAVVIDGSYVILDGLEFEGNNANLTLEGAQESYLQSRRTPAIFNANYNTNAMTIGKTTTAHHIIVQNCKVHDFPGGGIGVSAADYVTIENNLVYNNSWYTMYATSGISIFGPKPIDAVTTYKMIIRGNIVHNNKTQIFWRTSSGNDRLSDGNGIILDANNGTQGTAKYTGRTLVANNVSYNNGGGGIHAYQAARIDIINNTAYNNGTVVGYPEIDGQDCEDVRIFNNIMYARTGGNCNGNDAAIYNYNVYFNGPFFKKGANDLVIDPEFVKLAKDASADFRLKSTSPVINSGSMVAGQFSPTDILGTVRPQGSSSDRGAYEYQSGTQPQTITFNPLPVGKKAGDLDFDPQATASSGLPVIYKTSNTAVATIVDGKIRFEGPGTVTITASQNGDATYSNAPDVIQQLTVLDDGFRVAELPLSTINGLNYQYYEGQWTELPDFTTLTPVKTGIVANIDLSPRQREDNFAFIFKGYIDIQASGVYTFYTASGAVSRLHIGDSLVVNNSGGPDVTRQSGMIGLKKGKHLITITYANGSASNGLTVSYSSPVLPETVIPASSFYRANPNLVANGNFDQNTNGWSLTTGGGAVATVEIVEKADYPGKAAKIIPTASGTGFTNIQFRSNVPLVKDYTYAIRFKASADAPRNMDFLMQMDVSPFSNNFSRFNTAITTTPTYYTYTFTAPRTDPSNLIKFNVGNSLIPVYIDEVEVVRVFSPEMSVKLDGVEVPDNTTFSFGNLEIGSSKTLTFVIENTGNNILHLTGNPTITVGGAGFDSPQDAPVIIEAGGTATFQLRFKPDAAKTFSGTLSIANSDLTENPYNFTLAGTGVKEEQSINFPELTAITYGEANVSLSATSTSGLPVTFAVVSGPGVITGGNTLSYTGADTIVVEATQAGNNRYNAAPVVRRQIIVKKKELVVTAENKIVTYGDPVPAYTYTITGFVLGQTSADITGTPVLNSTYSPSTPATESPMITVTLGTLNAGNYIFTTVNGKVIIAHTFPLLLEAEKAAIHGGDIRSVFTGYTGTGYVDHINKPNDYIRWTPNVSGAGMCTLKFRYALNSKSQTFSLTVNGTRIRAGVTFTNTGSWRKWAIVSVPVYLNAGINTVQLNAVCIAGPNIDHLVIESSIFSPNARTQFSGLESAQNQGSAFDSQLDISVYPVPAQEQVTIAMEARKGATLTINLIDNQGRVHLVRSHVARQEGINAVELDVKLIPPGIYTIRATSGAWSKCRMISIIK
jgi:hypothetical protein